MRKGGRGFPTEIIQKEKTRPTEQMAVRGTLKAAVLKGASDCPDLVPCSVYDTKPVKLPFDVHGLDSVGGKEKEGLGQIS